MNTTLTILGYVSSTIVSKEGAPKMETKPGAVRAELRLDPKYLDAMDGLNVGDKLELLTWLHLADRTTTKVHPCGVKENPLRGVFATRSPDRPNPIGLHRVTLMEIKAPATLVVEPLEALNGTPVVDIKIKPKAEN